jgi:hypothetical protein
MVHLFSMSLELPQTSDSVAPARLKNEVFGLGNIDDAKSRRWQLFGI